MLIADPTSKGEPTLGTSLRHLVELLDGAVQRSYQRSGLDYRPRYTPVVRALMKAGPCSVRAISMHAGITHSAASQTVAQMAKDKLVSLASGADRRERIVSMTTCLQQMLPKLGRSWAATNRAAARLDEELSAPLSGILREALIALERSSFDERIAAHLWVEPSAC